MDRISIQFTLRYREEVVRVTTYQGEFRNLMVLINEKMFVEDFGECKGIGRCGTCLVSVVTPTALPRMDRNESETLKKAGVQGDQWRLSCQVMIDPYLDAAEITVAEEREDVR